jgi:glycosyltransferase involved in cell wall biosynthesis
VEYCYTFTVFTPTYNRCRTLPRVYESLRPQTYRNFEWLIVDDGSADGTKELVEKWQAESEFPIRYFYQENHGKAVAFNRGVQEAQGELFLTLDSDDACVPQALERFKYHWDSIPLNQRDNFSAITVLGKDQNGRLVGDKFARDVLDSDSIELVFKYQVKGDKWGFHRTDILRQFPFPVFPNVKFIPEALLWFTLSRKFKTRFVNEVLLINYVNDGAEDHLSSLSPEVMFGRALFHKYVLNELVDWLYRSPTNLFRSAINFSRYSIDLGKGPYSQFKELRPLTARILLAMSLPVGFAMSLKDKRNLARASRDTALRQTADLGEGLRARNE